MSGNFRHDGCSPFHHHDEDDEDELHEDEEHDDEDDRIPVPDGEECEHCPAPATSEAGGLFLCDDCYSDYADGYKRD